MAKLTSSPAWQALKAHHAAIEPLRMRQMFRDDPARFDKFSVQLGSLLFDYSKNRINAETIELLTALARQAGLPNQIERMFAGEKINSTEQRAALHTALRNRSGKPVYLDGKDVMPDVLRVLAARAFDGGHAHILDLPRLVAGVSRAGQAGSAACEGGGNQHQGSHLSEIKHEYSFHWGNAL